MVCVFLADGFEEIEAAAPVDILRRAGIKTVIVGVGGKNIKGAHGVTVTADTVIEEIAEKPDMIVLPGGPGTRNLEDSPLVQKAIDKAVSDGIFIAAICAAPSILGHKGILKGKRAVCYPGYEKDLYGAQVADSQICTDGRIITGNGPGAAFAFGLELAEILGGNATDVKKGMLIKP